MSGQEHHLHPPETSQPQLIRRRTKGGVDPEFLNVLKTFHGVEPTTAKDPQTRLSEINGCRRGHGYRNALTLLPDSPY